MSEEPKPCPFCGSIPTIRLVVEHNELHRYAVMCATDECGMMGTIGESNSKEGAISQATEYWNRLVALPSEWKIWRGDDGSLVVQHDQKGGVVTYNPPTRENNVAEGILHYLLEDLITTTPNPQEDS